MKYTIDILRSAQKNLKKIEKQAQSRIISAIFDLSDNPRPAGCKKLSGRQAWRIRIGSYRVIYEIHDKTIHILVVAVGHRKNIY